MFIRPSDNPAIGCPIVALNSDLPGNREGSARPSAPASKSLLAILASWIEGPNPDSEALAASLLSGDGRSRAIARACRIRAVRCAAGVGPQQPSGAARSSG